MQQLNVPSPAAAAADDLSELRLDGRSALVTGSARGIGLAVATLLGRRGARVALFDRDADALSTAAEGLANGASRPWPWRAMSPARPTPMPPSPRVSTRGARSTSW